MTFNLVAALRLNDQGFSSGMRRANSSVREMTSGASSLTSQVAKIGAALGVTTLAVKGLTTAFQGAAQMEMDKLSLSTLVGDATKANELLTNIHKKANISVFSDKDFMQGAKALLPIMHDVNKVNDGLAVMERLASSNPLEGMNGAAFSMREFLSGDITSLAERFNIPKKMLKDNIKGTDTVIDRMKALDKTLTELGFTQSYVNKVNTSASAQWQTLGSNVQTALAKMGEAALQKLKQPLSELNSFMQNGGLDWIKNKGSDFLTGAVSKAVELGNYVKNNWPMIKQKFADFNQAMAPIKTGLGTILNAAKSVGSYISKHWDGTVSVVLALSAAVVTFKTAMLGLTVISTVINLVRGLQIAYGVLTGAQWALNIAMDANPVGAVILALSALVGIGVYVYRNFDVIKAKATELWQKYGNLITIISALTGPIGMLITAGIKLYQNFDTIKTKAVDVWTVVKQSAASAVNSVISDINAMISVLNKIPGVKIPIVPKVNWGAKNPNTYGYSQSNMAYGYSNSQPHSHHGGLSNVPYDGYMARLHRNERVLTAVENDEYKKNKGGSTVQFGNIIITGGSTTRETVDQLMREITRRIEEAGVLTG